MKLRALSRDTGGALILFAATDLVFTALNLQIFGTSHSSGSLRPLTTVLPKIAQLAIAGAALGALASSPSRHLNWEFLTASMGFTILVDLDHVPVVLGMQQPIRPSHSILFLMIAVFVIQLLTRKRHLSALATSAFLSHLALDKPLFPLIAPLSPTLFEYGIDVQVGLAALSAGLALLSGLMIAEKRNN